MSRPAPSSLPRLFPFVGAEQGLWAVRSARTLVGDVLPPAVAKRLHHCRDLGPAEPFDFLTWFDFAPEHEPAFDDMLLALRNSPEWAYVDREVDIRLVREPA